MIYVSPITAIYPNSEQTYISAGSIGQGIAINDVGVPNVNLAAARDTLWVRIYDKNGDLQMVLDERVNLNWEYNRVGGCGQCEIDWPTADSDILIGTIRPESSVKIYINQQLRYQGKIIRFTRSITNGDESVKIYAYGYLIELDTLVITASYSGMAIGAIVRDILTNYVTPYSNIIFNSSDVDDTDYAVTDITFNHTVSEALQLLAGLGGNIEWGVNRNRSFFFKVSDTNVRRVYVLGREISNFSEERRDDGIVNVVNIYGGADNELITTMQSSLSIAVYGRKTANIFESSISTFADAVRLGITQLKQLTAVVRSVRFTFVKNDEFVEDTVPIGATAVTKSRINSRTKYGHNAKYGRNIKYGNLRRDQFSNVVYTLINGGFSVDANLGSDLPNLGDLQSGIEKNVRDLQRR